MGFNNINFKNKYKLKVDYLSINNKDKFIFIFENKDKINNKRIELIYNDDNSFIYEFKRYIESENISFNKNIYLNIISDNIFYELAHLPKTNLNKKKIILNNNFNDLYGNEYKKEMFLYSYNFKINNKNANTSKFYSSIEFGKIKRLFKLLKIKIKDFFFVDKLIFNRLFNKNINSNLINLNINTKGLNAYLYEYDEFYVLIYLYDNLLINSKIFDKDIKINDIYFNIISFISLLDKLYNYNDFNNLYVSSNEETYNELREINKLSLSMQKIESNIDYHQNTKNILKAFTLVEVIVSMFIFATILGITTLSIQMVNTQSNERMMNELLNNSLFNIYQYVLNDDSINHHLIEEVNNTTTRYFESFDEFNIFEQTKVEPETYFFKIDYEVNQDETKENTYIFQVKDASLKNFKTTVDETLIQGVKVEKVIVQNNN